MKTVIDILQFSIKPSMVGGGLEEREWRMCMEVEACPMGSRLMAGGISAV